MSVFEIALYSLIVGFLLGVGIQFTALHIWREWNRPTDPFAIKGEKASDQWSKKR